MRINHEYIEKETPEENGEVVYHILCKYKPPVNNELIIK